MKRILLLTMLILTGLLLSISATAEGESYYLQLNGIEGSCEEHGHDKWIEVLSFSIESETGNPTRTFTFRHPIDNAVKKLTQASEDGLWIRGGKLEICQRIAGQLTTVNCADFGAMKVIGAKICEEETDGESLQSVQEVTIQLSDVNWTVNTKSLSEGGCGYMRLDGMEGNANAEGRQGWIELTAFSSGETIPYYGIDFTKVTFEHPIDGATPKLQEFCLSEHDLYSGELDARERTNLSQTAGMAEYEDILILRTEVHTEASPRGGLRAVEEVTLRCYKEKWTVTPDASASSAGGNYFLRLNSIAGESHDSDYQGWIDVLSFSTEYQNVSNSDSKTIITFRHQIDAATPQLRDYLKNGNRIESGEINVRKTIGDEPTVISKNQINGIKLIKAIVYTEEKPYGGTRFIEEVTLQCDKDNWEVLPHVAPLPQGKDRIFLRLSNIEGESSGGAHEKWIDVISYSDDDVGTLTFSHSVDAATPKLQEYCKKGTVILNESKLHVCQTASGKQVVVHEKLYNNMRINKAAIMGYESEIGNTQVVEELTLRYPTNVPVPTKTPAPPKTGDSTPIPLYLLVLIIAGTGPFIMILALSREDKRDR